MKNLTKGEVIALILAIAKKVAGEQATGISNITWNGQTNSLVFTMSDGSEINTPITLDASDISYSNTSSGLDANIVQTAIDEVVADINAILNNTKLINRDGNNVYIGNIIDESTLTSTNTNTVIIGNNAQCEDIDGGVVVGNNANIQGNGNNDIAIGTRASTSSGDNIAIGYQARARSSIVIGSNAGGLNYGGNICIGDRSTFDGSRCLMLGHYATTKGDSSIAIGSGTSTSSSPRVQPATTTVGNTIQLGGGTNSTENTFQVWDYTMLDRNTGLIPNERLSSDIATSNDVYIATGNSIVLICNGTISSNEAIFTVENDSDYDTDLLVNGKEFEVDMNLAVSGDIPLDIPMYIQFKGYKTPIYNILVNNTTATVRDMLQLSKYENETGYRWIAKMRYILVSEPAAVRAFGIISTVTQQDIIRISNEDFLDYLTNGGLPQGQVALCDEIVSGSYNGYLLGHFYKFNIVYGETNQYSWTDITPAGLPATTATINGNADTYTIANGGTYIFLGDVGTLTITATDDVTVSVLGTLGSVTLPETTQTILIHTVGYSGTFDTRPNSLKNGSVLGPYNIGRIDLA